MPSRPDIELASLPRLPREGPHLDSYDNYFSRRPSFALTRQSAAPAGAGAATAEEGVPTTIRLGRSALPTTVAQEGGTPTVADALQRRGKIRRHKKTKSSKKRRTKKRRTKKRRTKKRRTKKRRTKKRRTSRNIR